MTLHAAENVSAGAKTGNIKSHVFTETSGTQAKWDDFSFTVTITPNSTGIIEISAFVILFHREELTLSVFFNQMILPAAGLCAVAAIRVASGHKG